MRVLIIDKMHESIMPMMQEAGIVADYEPAITRAEILDKIANYDGMVVRSKTTIDKPLLQAGINLKFVARAGAGMDQVDEEYAASRNIALLNAPEGNRDAVGEHTLGMLLVLANKLHTGDQEVRCKEWKREFNRGWEIKGKTVGIVGFGNMGSSFAKRLLGFECEVIAYDKYKTGFGTELVKEVTEEELFERADIVSYHIPLTEVSRFFINDEYLSKFRKNIVLLNTARGEIIKLQTIVNGLKSGKIIAAALDVLENEKFSSLTEEQENNLQYLFQQPNVLFTPHVGGWTHESYVRINETLVNKIKSLNLE